MGKIKIYMAIIVISILLIGTCLSVIFLKSKSDNEEYKTSDIYECSSYIYEKPKLGEEIKKKVKSLTLEEKIAQMLIITYPRSIIY